jgi:CheY-like chemotaxis protein
MRKYKIIIVENDEDEQQFMAEGFNEAGFFEVLAILGNGNALMDWLQQNPSNLPDLVLSDLNMPGKNGYDIIVEIKENPSYAHIPVIITSTSSTKVFIDKCFSLGAAEYQVKPETFIEYGPYVENLHRIVIEKALLK